MHLHNSSRVKKWSFTPSATIYHLSHFYGQDYIYTLTNICQSYLLGITAFRELTQPEIILLKDSMYTVWHWKSEQQATWQDTACSLCRGDVHSSSEVGSSAAVDIANTGISHSYDHQVWQLGSLSVLLSFLHTSDVPLWQNISRNNSETNNTLHVNHN